MFFVDATGVSGLGNRGCPAGPGRVSVQKAAVRTGHGRAADFGGDAVVTCRSGDRDRTGAGLPVAGIHGANGVVA